MRQDCIESARERRLALYKIDQNNKEKEKRKKKKNIYKKGGWGVGGWGGGV